MDIYIPPLLVVEGWRYNLDPNVYTEYASILIPKAISYSAGLLNYFFRGQMEAQADGNDGIKITNLLNESMDGDFELYYDAVDPVTNEESRKRAGGPWDMSLAPGDQSNPQSFTPPTDAKDPDKYVLVFKGTLGAEAEAVVGKMVELVTSPFVFIVQERTSAGSINAQEKKTHHESDFYPSDTAFRILDVPGQELSGRFVTYGAIKAIYLSGASQLSINGSTLAGTSWIPGDTPDVPLTWKVAGISAGQLNVSLRVEMDSGEVFVEPLWFYYRSTRSGSGISGTGAASQFLSTDMSLTTNRITIAKSSDLVLGGPGSTSSRWKIVQIKGHRPEDNFTTYEHENKDYGLPIWSFSESKKITTSSGKVTYQHNWNEAVSLWHYACAGWCISNPTVENLKARYDSIFQEEDFIDSNFGGAIERRYTAAELDDLSLKGIDPVHYAIFLQ